MAGRLEERPYGRTGDTVSVIGLGGSCRDKRSLEAGTVTVRRALELGITCFDTTPSWARCPAIYTAQSRRWMTRRVPVYLDDRAVPGACLSACGRTARSVPGGRMLSEAAGGGGGRRCLKSP